MAVAVIAGGAWLEWMLAAGARLECFGLGKMPVEQEVVREDWLASIFIRPFQADQQ